MISKDVKKRLETLGPDKQKIAEKLLKFINDGYNSKAQIQDSIRDDVREYVIKKENEHDPE